MFQGLVKTSGVLMSALLLSTLVVSGAVAGTTLKTGDAVPSFSAKDQKGTEVSSTSLKGTPFLLYFYPKDETPGCTQQACALRDSFAEFKKRGARVYGISRQDAASHQAFIQKHRIPFDLLIDEDGALAEKMGVGLYPVVGLHKRQSVLVSAQGRVIRFYDSVDPAKHPAEVLKDLDAATKKAE